eukprot:scaffold91710_cov41-Attheya_sp.AAC.2
MRGLLAVYRRRCDRAAAMLLLLLSRLMSWVVWGLLAFPLLKLHPLRGVGVGLAGKGGMVGSGTKLSFGLIQYESSGGAWRGQRRGNGIRMLDDGLLGVTCYPASFCT